MKNFARLSSASLVLSIVAGLMPNDAHSNIPALSLELLNSLQEGDPILLDTDGDGIEDLIDEDDDGDGIPDLIEIAFGYNPLDPNSGPGDDDFDGADNYEEILAGSDPANFIDCLPASCKLDEAPASPQSIAIPAVDPISDEVGATRGRLTVTSSGAANYVLPIAVPEGTGGLRPELQLVYNSNSGSGQMGVGWSYSGVSMITRCPQSERLDGEDRAVSYTNADRFCLDGQRLVRVDPTDTYGGHGVEYRTEYDSGLKIESRGMVAGSPEYFDVFEPNGNYSRYGSTPNTRIQPANGPIVAYAKQYTESLVSGSLNRINYVYHTTSTVSDNLNIRLNDINYASADGITRARVQFIYEERSDIAFSYRGGLRTARPDRLARIDVFDASQDPNSKFRSYQFEYSDSQAGNLSASRLVTITECALNSCLPPTELTWSGEGITQRISDQATQISGSLNFPQHAIDDTLDENFELDYLPIDVNGDGMNDIAWIANSSGSKVINLAISNGSTLVSSQYSSSAFDDIRGWSVLDYNSDGYADILLVVEESNGASLKLLLNEDFQGTRGISTSATTLLTSLSFTSGGENAKFVDYNGDGLLDLLYDDEVRFLVRDPANALGPYEFSSTPVSLDLSDIQTAAVSAYTSSSLASVLVNYNPKNTSTGYSPIVPQPDDIDFSKDFDGDGIKDIWLTLQQAQCDSAGCEDVNNAAHIALRRDGSGSYSLYDYIVVWGNGGNKSCTVVDLNQDGLPDALCTGGLISFNTGKGFLSTPVINNDGVDLHALHSLMDYNKDGYLDYIYKENGTTNIKVMLWNGEKFDSELNAIVVAQTGYTERYGPEGIFLDINGDTIEDYININTGVQLGIDGSTPSNSTKRHHLLTKIKDGLGHEQHIYYEPVSNPEVYSRGVDTALLNWDAPVLDSAENFYVVSSIRALSPSYDPATSSIDILATHGTDYHYEGFRVQPALAGRMGFEKVISTDVVSGVVTEQSYLQRFPYTGRLESESTYVAGEPLALSESTYTYQVQTNLNGVTYAPYRVVKTHEEVVTRAALSDSSSSNVQVGGVTSQVNVTYSNFNAHGMFESMTKVVTGDGLTHTETQSLDYNHNVTSAWLLNMLQHVSITRHTSGKPSITNETSFTYNTNNGLMTSKTIEPNNPAYSVTTTYEYDAFGNETKVTESDGQQSRYTRTVYDSSGRFVSEVYNSLEQREYAVLQRDALGRPTETVDSNGIKSYTVFGAFGYKQFEGNDLGQAIAAQRRMCDVSSGCPTGATTYETTSHIDGSESVSYRDNLGRVVRIATKSFNGQYSIRDTQFNVQGSPARVSAPYFAGAPIYWTSHSYDDINRQTSATDADSNIQSISYNQHGTGSFVTTLKETTNSENQTKTERTNALNQTVYIEDSLGGRISYSYDSSGNLTILTSLGSTTDSHNIQTTLTYDLLGRRISIDDPDQGQWEYEYNKLGQIVRQEDSLGQSTEMQYDALGRLVRRIDLRSDGTTVEGDSYWDYDTAPNGTGKVSTITDTVSGYVQAYDYDTFGRLRQRYTALGIDGVDGEYDELFTYDEFSRPFQVIDPTYHGVQYSYNQHGYLQQISEAADSNVSYKEFASSDAWGNSTGAYLGNGLTEQNTYSAKTGQITESQTTNMVSAIIHHNQYTYNSIGAVVQRDRYVAANDAYLGESFHYDELNRLTQVTADGYVPQQFQYDSVGNLTSKTGVGSYSYGAGGAGPHAATTVGTDTYQYDAAGNMTQGGGRNVIYTTFRKPANIIKGGASSYFEYGPDRSHYKRVDTNGTDTTEIIRIANIEFIETNGGPKTYRRYIHDFAIVTYDAQGQTSEQYLHKDSVGSTDVITNNVGLIVAELSFDAFGSRRSPASLGNLTALQRIELTQITYYGFTGHEMVDDVGIIHMKGRIYDPNIGRFMSADPIVSLPKNSQRLNRYSYVMNNPINLVDPSGFDSCKDASDLVNCTRTPALDFTGYNLTKTHSVTDPAMTVGLNDTCSGGGGHQICQDVIDAALAQAFAVLQMVNEAILSALMKVPVRMIPVGVNDNGEAADGSISLKVDIVPINISEETDYTSTPNSVCHGETCIVTGYESVYRMTGKVKEVWNGDDSIDWHTLDLGLAIEILMRRPAPPITISKGTEYGYRAYEHEVGYMKYQSKIENMKELEKHYLNTHWTGTKVFLPIEEDLTPIERPRYDICVMVCF